MNAVLKSFDSALTEAGTAAVSRKPDGNREASYLLGWLQGRYDGILTGRRIIEKYLDDQDEHDKLL